MYGPFKTKSAMLKAAKEFLINNPTLDLKAFREANPGITVVLQNKAGRDKPPQVAIRTKSKPGYRDWTKGKTVEEQEYIRNFKKETTRIRKQESESLLHRHSTGASDKSKIYSITEHNQQGGDPTDLSRSDPFFKEHKDKLERRLTADFGDDMRVGVNSQGETIFGPSKFWNELDPERSPGVQTLYQGQELSKEGVKIYENIEAKQLRGKPFSQTLDNFKALTPSAQRKVLSTLTLAGAATLYGGFGTAISAAETEGRRRLASKTKNPVDWLQFGISGISLGADGASYHPLLSIPGSIISGAADVTNLSIDQLREGPSAIRGRSGAKKAIEARRIEEEDNLL